MLVVIVDESGRWHPRLPLPICNENTLLSNTQKAAKGIEDSKQRKQNASSIT